MQIIIAYMCFGTVVIDPLRTNAVIATGMMSLMTVHDNSSKLCYLLHRIYFSKRHSKLKTNSK